MRTALRTVLACTTLALSLAATAAFASGRPAFAWPQGQRAAVSLAYDDAVPTHLDVAIPALDRHGLKGSFYLTLAAAPVRERLEAWRAAARSGHELGNHSLFHQCSARGPGREWVQPAQDLDTTSVAQMRAQLEVANTMLRAIDGSTEFTFTAPCGDRMARDGDYIGEVAGLFVGIKLVGGTVVPDMWTLDPAAVPVTVPVDARGADLIALVEEAGRLGTMVNFTFHGIGGDHLSVSREAHDELLAFLAAHRDRYWTDTFRNQMRWVREQQARAPLSRTSR
ncbi:polysaccharide deacetylase family protein [Luteimonas sp. SDU82]|uniref:polysaccharide deacetylase family protein n=1 Tax=Luteimonas sp. SDU82 TaxID=3422592 RepID=UPI003EBDE53D